MYPYKNMYSVYQRIIDTLYRMYWLFFSAVHCPAAHLDPPFRRWEPRGRRPGRPRPRARAGERVRQQDQGLHQGGAVLHGEILDATNSSTLCTNVILVAFGLNLSRMRVYEQRN